MAFYLAQAAKACKNPATRSVYSASALLRLSASTNRIPNAFTRLTAPYNYTPTLSSTLNFTRYASSAATALKPEVPHDTTTAVAASGAEEAAAFTSLEGVISEPVLDAITRRMKISHLSPVQKEVLPLLPELARPYNGEEPAGSPPRDILVKAKTGTGKTLAFLVPAIEKRLQEIEHHVEQAAKDVGKTEDSRFKKDVRYQYTKESVGTVILSPTRELASQIGKEALKLTSGIDGGRFGVQVFVGGEDKRNQLRNWRNGRRDIVVATPGRMKDLLENEPDFRRGIESAQLLILDEADTLLEMGFRQDIESISSHLPPSPQRQTFLFSATVSPQIREIARSTLDKKHQFINCVPVDDAPVHSHVPQYHTVCPSPADQLPHILRLIAHDQLTNPGASKVIVFLPTTKGTQLFATMLDELKNSVLPAGRSTQLYEIHSKKDQERRTRTSNKFRNDKSGASVLVTSDVSARGVDYPGVTRVIQIGIASSGDHYVHRIGRTGRGSSTVSGRGDLVLLDWEAGFAKPGGTLDQLGVPLKGITVNALKEEVEALAQKFDEDPQAFFAGSPAADAADSGRGKIRLGGSREAARAAPRSGPVGLKDFQSPMSKTVASDAIEETVDGLKRRMDDQDIKEVFIANLGFYFGKMEDLSLNHRSGKSDILEGLKKWTVEGCGLEVPPYVSEAFLAKIGGPMNRGGQRGGGGGQRGGGQRGGGFGMKRDGGDRFGSRGGRGDRGDRPSGTRERSFERSFDGERSERRSQPWQARGNFNSNRQRDGEGSRRRSGRDDIW